MLGGGMSHVGLDEKEGTRRAQTRDTSRTDSSM